MHFFHSLFYIEVSDLPTSSSGPLIKYADFTRCLPVSRDDELDNPFEASNFSNRLVSLNPSKCSESIRTLSRFAFLDNPRIFRNFFPSQLLVCQVQWDLAVLRTSHISDWVQPTAFIFSNPKAQAVFTSNITSAFVFQYIITTLPDLTLCGLLKRI